MLELHGNGQCTLWTFSTAGNGQVASTTIPLHADIIAVSGVGIFRRFRLLLTRFILATPQACSVPSLELLVVPYATPGKYYAFIKAKMSSRKSVTTDLPDF